jgi:hypothetical protein
VTRDHLPSPLRGADEGDAVGDDGVGDDGVGNGESAGEVAALAGPTRGYIGAVFRQTQRLPVLEATVTPLQ